jgi:hypothetical protein
MLWPKKDHSLEQQFGILSCFTMKNCPTIDSRAHGTAGYPVWQATKGRSRFQCVVGDTDANFLQVLTQEYEPVEALMVLKPTMQRGFLDGGMRMPSPGTIYM